MTKDELDELRKRAKAILGYTPLKKACFLCQTPNEEIPKGAKLPLRNCIVRKCVTQMGIKNCAYCSRFPCDYEKEHASLWNRAMFEKKLGKPISDEDYQKFIKPFEALDRLEKIRARLKPDQIIEVVPLDPLTVKIIDFPEKLPYSTQETKAFQNLHKLLGEIKQSPLHVDNTDLFPQQTRLKNRIKNFLRFLLIFGLHGILQEENVGSLLINAKAFSENRGTETGLLVWDFTEKVIFKIFPEFGVHCELIVLSEPWLTPMGYLRSKGWQMKISFDKQIGGLSTLKALQAYAKKLAAKYGKKDHLYFKNVDMRVLTEL
jgi:hypothetical protein